jgi:hypothetical protein
MLDLFGIMFSSIIMFMVILRAIQMDTLLPWFRPPKTGVDSSGLRLRPDSQEPNGRAARRDDATRASRRDVTRDR